MSALLAAYSLITALNGPASPNQAAEGASICSRKDHIICIQSNIRAGDGGAGGAGKQYIVCNYCTLGGPVGGGGGNGAPASGSRASQNPPSTAVNKILSRCTLIIAGVTYVDAAHCMYGKAGDTFTLTAPDTRRKYTYSISVTMSSPGVGRGSLSGGNTPGSRPLGAMSASGACWVSNDQSVKVCAWI